MKTIFYSLAVVVSSFFMMVSASAQYAPSHPDPYHRPDNERYHDDRRESFYYYPQSNVYYNPVADRYIFLSRNAWVVSDRLPHYYRIHRERSFIVYHKGFDVWNDNRKHCAKYRDYRRMSPDVAYDRGNPYDGGNNYPDNRQNYPDRRDGWRK